MNVKHKILIGLVVIFSASSSLANEVNLRLCTASPTGNYYAFGEQFARQLKRSSLTVDLIVTDGSMDNLQRMANNDCDGGIVQIDAYLDYQNAHPHQRLDIRRPIHLYDEFIHMVCRKGSGIMSIKDFESQPDAHKLLVGDTGSGGAITWDSFSQLNSNYSKVRIEHIGGDEALRKVQEGTASCLLFISGLRSKYSATIDDSDGLVSLVEVDDRDLGNKEFLGEPIYNFKNIPADTYKNLQAPSGDKVETLTVRAIFIVNSAWAGAYPELFDILDGGIERALPLHKAKMGIH